MDRLNHRNDEVTKMFTCMYVTKEIKKRLPISLQINEKPLIVREMLALLYHRQAARGI